MRGDRFVVLAASRPRRSWFTAVGAWADGGLLPVQVVKCLSVEELRGRLDTATASAVLVDAGLGGVDRDLFSAARDRGIAALVVDDAD